MKHQYVNFIQSSQPTSYIHPIFYLTTQNMNDHAFYTTALGNQNLHKTVVKHHFSLMIFASTQVLMDIAPLLGIVYGWQYLHLYTHHLVGALLIGSISPLIIKPISKWFLRLFKYQLQNFMRIAYFSALIGSFSHILFDAFVHIDMYPFFQLSPLNTLSHSIEYPQLFWSSIFMLIIDCAIACLQLIAFTNYKK